MTKYTITVTERGRNSIHKFAGPQAEERAHSCFYKNLKRGNCVVMNAHNA